MSLSKNTSFIFLVMITFVLVSCKTQEQIRREKMLDNVAQQVGVGQRLNAETTLKTQQLENSIAALQGKVEELQHELEKWTAEVLNLQEINKTRETEIQEIRQTLTNQKTYLDEVLASLSELAKEKGKKNSEKKDKKDKKSQDNNESSDNGPKEEQTSEYDEAMEAFDKSQFKEAHSSFIKLLENKKINGNKRAKILHNLGIIEYLEKNYDNASIYFGRLFTEHPGSSLNSSGLFHLGLSFKAMKKNDEAKQIFKELIDRYPKNKNVKAAKDILKKM